MKCKQCGKPADIITQFTKHSVCDKCARENHAKAVGKVKEKYPSIPAEIYDIEASEEVAMMYGDMFGY